MPSENCCQIGPQPLSQRKEEALLIPPSSWPNRRSPLIGSGRLTQRKVQPKGAPNADADPLKAAATA
ncbi:hypothetical protein CNMCM5623_008760 [Aspergillus felis]|uniref:Uncharacterized protein n=1 Tax=Aspergillus felis TaxID=1287682 RepID=A0A8H6PJK0_9EURO|nr:hypothetical protein CNMCM5623_008760 [Aspergillus felis]KAF7181435.1 hypothetical protein CNMCM7691_000653 [Aspergillus felis]